MFNDNYNNVDKENEEDEVEEDSDKEEIESIEDFCEQMAFLRIIGVIK